MNTLHLDSNVTLPDLFEAQVAQNPAATALVFRKTSLTYGELNERSNRLAHLLMERGIGPEDVIAVSVPRSIEMIVSILGILKAGAAYMPLDLGYPSSRLRFMLEDARPRFVLTMGDHTSTLPNTTYQLTLDQPEIVQELEHSAVNNPQRPWAFSPESAAYIIYTSGSTGSPKGCVVPHRSIPGFIFGVDYVEFNERQVLLQYSSVSWDVLTLELWPALLTGGRSVLFDETRVDPVRLGEAIRENGVTILWLTSTLFNGIIDTDPGLLRSLQCILVGGEALSAAHIRRAVELLPGIRIVNGYGPSECTVFSCCHRISEEVGATIPIGKPIGDRYVYLLNEDLNATPVGPVGEIYVAGPAVARGYLNRI
jgi:amino acid adenylation domain-containing protein